MNTVTATPLDMALTKGVPLALSTQVNNQKWHKKNTTDSFSSLGAAIAKKLHLSICASSRYKQIENIIKTQKPLLT